jgi:hypothetical protein
MADTYTSSVWAFDKHIPIALLCAILAQTGGALWWAATTSSRVEVLERQQTAMMNATSATAQTAATYADRLTRLETKFDYVVSGLDDVKAILRQPPTKAIR